MNIQNVLLASIAAATAASASVQPVESSCSANLSGVTKALVSLSINGGAQSNSVQDYVTLSTANPYQRSSLQVHSNTRHWRVTAEAIQQSGDLSAISINIENTNAGIAVCLPQSSHTLDKLKSPTIVLRGTESETYAGDNIPISYQLNDSANLDNNIPVTAIVQYKILASLD